MMNVARNAPCPCGSGRRYKHCHGTLQGIAAHPARVIPPQIREALRNQQLAEFQHRANHGDVREPITAEVNGFRFVAVGHKLIWSQKWKVFPDFLNAYIHGLLGSEWGSSQVVLPFDQQNPIVQWRTIFTTIQQTQQPNEAGLFSLTNGAALAWFRLAYDLYLLEHNAHLQKRLVRRLRQPAQFQGARFEAVVAAVMLAAGYDLNFANERLPGKHPEFVAVSKETSNRLAVEAKSRHRPGILGHPGKLSDSVDSFDIGGLLVSALEKGTEEPLLVFIELNSPEFYDERQSEHWHAMLNAHWQKVQSLTWPKGFPAVGVVFYNDPSPWYLEKLPAGESVSAMALVMWPESSRHEFDAKPLLKRVVKAVAQRLNIPHEFPSARGNSFD